jgi:hypothetical protein
MFMQKQTRQKEVYWSASSRFGVNEGMTRRLLIINPALVRLNAFGACEQDRMAHVRRMIERGFTVRLLTGWMPYQQREAVEALYADLGIPVDLFPAGTQARHPARLTRFAHLDGMAWEYAAPAAHAALARALAAHQPDLVWCHGSYLWAMARAARARHLPVVIRSVNYEPEQLMHENAAGAGMRLRYAAKVRGERHAVRSGVVAAISPDEAALYARLHPAARVELLPLQTLPPLLHPPRPAALSDRPLRAFFMGASYNIAHNRAALDFLLHAVIPLVRQRAPGAFTFHILGSKLPPAAAAHAAPDLHFPGYVPDLDAALAEMDIALAPSLAGAGMQQKVFEPLARAFPTITHRRALAGYDFTHGVHLLLAEDASTFVDALLRLRDPDLRAHLSASAARQSAALFNRSALDAAVDRLLTRAEQENRER